MSQLVVVTTPSCGRCKVIKKIVSDLKLEDKVGFTSFDSDLGMSLLEKYPGISAGIIIDPNTGQEFPVADLKNLVSE